MTAKLAQFTDVRVALVVGGLSLQVQAATLRTQPEVVVATPARPRACPPPACTPVRTLASTRARHVTSAEGLHMRGRMGVHRAQTLMCRESPGAHSCAWPPVHCLRGRRSPGQGLPRARPRCHHLRPRSMSRARPAVRGKRARAACDANNPLG